MIELSGIKRKSEYAKLLIIIIITDVTMDNKPHSGIESQKTHRVRTAMLDDQLGRVLRPADMADYLGIDEKTVRLYYHVLGGIRLGRQILFFEREVLNAVQKRSKMGSPSESGWQEEGENFSHQERCGGMGKREPVKSRADMAGEDKHGVIV